MNNIIIGSLNRRTVMGYSAHCDCFIASPAPFINIQTYLLSKGWLDRAEGHSPPPAVRGLASTAAQKFVKCNWTPGMKI